MMIMKSVTDCNGFEAWHALHSKYNPRLFARSLRLLTNVVNPGRIKNFNEVEAGITLWEEKVSQLDSQFNENVTDSLKMVILINAMPSGVQDHVISQMSKGAKYDEVKDIIKRYAARKAEAHNGPSPMDVGGMSGQYDEYEE